MRVRIRVRLDDFDDFEFDSFGGVLLALEGMKKSLLNTDWLAGPMTDAQREAALACIDTLQEIAKPFRVAELERIAVGESEN